MPSDYLSFANVFNILKARELNGKTKDMLPNTFPEYHPQAFKNHTETSSVSDIVIAGDIIFVLHDLRDFIPYLRNADGEIAPLTDDNGSRVIMRSPDTVDFVCYNNYNDSLLIIGGFPRKVFNSISISSIIEGQTTSYRRYFQSDEILHWDFDVPNCRGMIYNPQERLFTIFELKDYKKLFTIPDESWFGYLHFRFLSPCNPEMVIYNDNYNSSGEIPLKIYSKLNGNLRKQISLGLHPRNPIRFIALCGRDTLLIQQIKMKMQIISIISESPEAIKTTEIEAQGCPYYLDKRELFVCYTLSNSLHNILHVCNLQGDILFTFPEIYLSRSLFDGGYYITKAQDILICRSPGYSSAIDVLNIVTGERLAKIANDNSHSSEIREAAVRHISALAYDERIVTGERLAKIANDNSHSSEIREAAVRHISALAYDERTREIFTGTIFGICCRWSNKILEDMGD